MTNKRKLMLATNVLSIVTVVMVGGCFRLRTGSGTIYYEAKSAAAVQALRSRIEPLRAALGTNLNFTEIIGRETLIFEGTTNGPFTGCFIRFDRAENDGSKNHQAVLVVGTTRTFSFAKQVHQLRELVEKPLGRDVLKQLVINFDPDLFDVR
jgi:hypothetical protein